MYIQLRIENLDAYKIKEIEDWINNLHSFHPHARKKWATSNPLSSNCISYIKELYTSGYGLKVIARELKTTYSRLRNLFQKYWNIPIKKGNDICYNKTREFRAKKAKEDPNNPFRNWICSQKRTKTNHGVQGYYINSTGQKIWLRSTYEFIYCKWLDANNIKYKYEEITFTLLNGETYRPDFLLEDGTIVEVKGKFYTNRRYKVDMLKEQYPDIKIVVVDEIESYTKLGYRKELNIWKEVRLLKN